LRLGARFILVIAAPFPYIDDVNINLTGLAFASSRMFTPSIFGSAIHAIQTRTGHPTLPSRSRSPPQPPDRVRARPVLHPEEPAAFPPQLYDCCLPKVGERVERRAGALLSCRRRDDGWHREAHLVLNLRDLAPPSPRGVLANATPRRFPLRLITRNLSFGI
jgi:hypothetical protein